MNRSGLLIRMHAKHGKEAALEAFLVSTLSVIERDEATPAWFAVRFARAEYGIFHAFADASARESYLQGPIFAALRERQDLCEMMPRTQKVEVLADKLPIVSDVPDTKGLLLLFKAKPGHEQDVEDFLRFAQEEVNNERHTTAWFAIRTDQGEYGIFDVFPGNEDRFLHLVGHVPRELAKQAFTLLGSMPEIEMLNVQAEKIGADVHRITSH